MATYTGRLGGETFAGFPARTLAFVRVPPAVPFVPSFDPVTDFPTGLRTPRPQTYTYPASVAPTFVPPLPAVTTWGQQEPTPVQDFKRQQFTYPTWAMNPAPVAAAAPPVTTWGQQEPVPVQDFRRQQFTFPTTVDAKPVPAAEVITVDKWWKQSELPFQGPKSRPDLSPSFAFTLLAVGETITVDKWYTVPGGPRQDSTRRQDLFSAGGFTARVAAAETITVDKWFHQTSRTLSGARANQYSYASTASFVELVTAAETITMDKWYNRTSTPVMDRARTQYTYSSYTSDTKTPVVVVTGVVEEERIELGSFFGITVPDIDLGIA